MKNCSSCDVDFENDTFSFCPICGKALLDKSVENTNVSSFWVERADNFYRDPSKDSDTTMDRSNRVSFDSYDGYYDDVMPIASEEKTTGGYRSKIIIRIACIVAGALIAIGLGIAAMYLI